MINQNIDPEFKKMTKDLIKYAMIFDKELLAGIDWLCVVAKEQGLTFSQIVYKILQERNTTQKAEEWIKTICRKERTV